MARKNRVWFPGATYHVTSRGNRQASIFYDNKDRCKYLDLLELTRETFPFELHSYCLMTNHIHLLLETIDSPLMNIMKMLNSRYAMYLNSKYDMVGHVFQGRYGAVLIEDRQHFLDTSRYIHLNPLEANIVSDPVKYRWSSYSALISNKDNKHISKNKTLNLFPEPASKYYKEYVDLKRESMEELI